MIFIVSSFCESNFPSWHFDDVRLNKSFFEKLIIYHHHYTPFTQTLLLLFFLNQLISSKFFSFFSLPPTIFTFLSFIEFCHTRWSWHKKYVLPIRNIHFTYILLSVMVLLNNSCYYRSTFQCFTWMNTLYSELQIYMQCRICDGDEYSIKEL